MQAQDKLNFDNTKPIAWLKRENEPKNITMSDITDKNNFIIVNPEEIGKTPNNKRKIVKLHFRMRHIYL